MIGNRKKLIGFLLGTVLIAGSVYWAWQRYGGMTEVALLNFPSFQTSSLMLAAEDSRVNYTLVKNEDIEHLDKYDVVLAFGMGLKWTDEERQAFKRLADGGVPVEVLSYTQPEDRISSLDSIQSSRIQEYYYQENLQNYASLAHYIRKYVDKKQWLVTEPAAAIEPHTDVYYHIDPNHAFDTKAELETYLKSQGYWHEKGSRVMILGGFSDPYSGNKEYLDSLITSLYKKGMNVYPVVSMRERMRFLAEVRPDFVIYFPHGRVEMGKGDAVVEMLKASNTPLFAPLTIFHTKKDWEADPMGLMGGFLGQSVAMPELDGAVYPYALVTEEKSESGIYMLRTIPERLDRFTDIIRNYDVLRRKTNSEKKLAIYYYPAPGQETLAAQGLETVPSLYNLLMFLQAQGYRVNNLPSTISEFRTQLQAQMKAVQVGKPSGKSTLFSVTELWAWINKGLSAEQSRQLVEAYGDGVGDLSVVEQNGQKMINIPHLQYGNIALIPQPAAGVGDDSFAIAHGANMAPPYPYVGAYLWANYAFGADARLHFGTHGSLEFTPGKQVALCDHDWADRLMGTVPHFYYYTIGNVGEGIIAKRRSYGNIVSYLTPPFCESGARGIYMDLQEAIKTYYDAGTNEAKRQEQALRVKQLTVQLGIHRDLRLDSVVTKGYSQEEIERIDNFAEEIASEKVNATLYTTGEPYVTTDLHSSILAIAAEPIAWAKAKIDASRDVAPKGYAKNKRLFANTYLNPAKELVERILSGKMAVSDEVVASYGNVSPEELHAAVAMLEAQGPRHGMQRRPESEARSGNKELAASIVELQAAINGVNSYKQMLQQSPGLELQALLNALGGGYIAPTSGGDAVANPRAIPTGRNLYSINAESTPTERAWSRGVQLVDETLKQYQAKHGNYPQKVSYTFWSSEFIESEGTTIAQVLYMLGVEPVRTGMGRVADLRLIPEEELGRPRIDVVVQTSGQFRDLAASRLELISKAIELASKAKDQGRNFVAEGTVAQEKALVEAGMSPREAREWSTARVFGGVNGMYGTGIQDMITAGDKWENEAEIAEVYINNMGAAYGSSETWGKFTPALFRAALARTDVVVQPRQSNSWGALSLDHVYEFMGGLSLSVRQVTGKDPEAYFADYRNRSNAKMQDLKEAIGVEARSTVLNPNFIRKMLAGGASSQARITEVVTNTYGWTVAKPSAIDQELWNELYEVYIEDKHKLGTRETFEKHNPAVLEEVSAVMLETIRKGMWKATPEQTAVLADLHAQVIAKYGSTGAGMGTENTKLQDFIKQNISTPQAAEAYQAQKEQATQGVVMKKETTASSVVDVENNTGLWVVIGVILAFVLLIVVVRRRRK